MKPQHISLPFGLPVLMFVVALLVMLAAPQRASAQTTPSKTVSPAPYETPTPVPDATPTPTPAPTPTPDPALQDLGSDDPAVDDSGLQEQAPVQDSTKPTTDADNTYAATKTTTTTSTTTTSSSTTAASPDSAMTPGTSSTSTANPDGSTSTTTYYPDGSTTTTWQAATINYGYTAPASASATCTRTLKASVVALDQVFFWNRLGALEPQGMMFALRHQVVPKRGNGDLSAGNVRLRADKRPRPLVLRMNVGDCLQVDFQNLLATTPTDGDQPATRSAGMHVTGLQLVGSIQSDGSNVGQNPSSLVAPSGRITYTWYAEREGPYFMYSTAANTGGEGDGGSIPAGLFGVVNVEPKGAEWYRSQVSENDLKLATKGYTADGHPIINYDATYPWWHRYKGLPIMKMMNKNNIIVHSDLNAIITGPGRGKFAAGIYPANPVEPNRDWPFREFSIVYHDEAGALQAFPQFYQNGAGGLKHTLHSVRDNFAINYGIAGIGAEILANRLGVGPMANCTECAYEEFFLSAWSVGDPAMVVDVPANTPCDEADLQQGHCTATQDNPTKGFKATKAFYPEDPSNVHHSYIGDHVKMRIVHAGPKEHHIHHLHAHQWLHTPDSDNSTYLDSQAIGPSSSFTLEIAHEGTGNRNQTVGDSIFHCHFYPHFAQGMWELWRSHDVFEAGTRLDGGGRPAPGARALPDAEIKRGTPIPAIVPLPGGAAANMAKYVMAPLPEAQVSISNGQAQISGTGNPGYPFFIAAQAGHRPSHPPLDSNFDGGLPRHIITGGTFTEQHTRLDFDKTLVTANATAIPETGTPVEQAAMKYHALRFHPSFMTDGTAGNYKTNGLPAVAGAPFADPCVTDDGKATGTPRIYKAAGIQFDMKLNKAGWHYPQARILALWGDVAAIQNGTKAPEPFFFRANTGDCITYYHTNLLPHVYAVDDFQVRTPTDVIGQHIHLVKFDVTASDGSGNGWNYEDGTFSPDTVIERIKAINATGGLVPFGGGIATKLSAQPHPFFGTLGAQTTIQRWYADDVTNNLGQDRTLRTVFTHDHFGPSTHQQTGLYAGLVIEPIGSTWQDSETGVALGGRFDGGPTSWKAVINAGTGGADSYREFMLEFADYQLAYWPNVTYPDPAHVINPPVRDEVSLDSGSTVLLEKANVCPSGDAPPCPEAVSSADVGTMSVNYRNEPIPLRVRDPNTNTQAAGDAGDLSMVYRSDVVRADPAFNTQPNFYPALTADLKPGDPYTPLLRAYENDKVQIRVLVGAHEEGHNFNIHGIKWLFEPSDANSGYRSSQMMGISEHYEFIVPTMPKNAIGSADYLYQPGAAVDDQWNGLWGLFRTYNMTRKDLVPLPNNANGHGSVISNGGDFSGVCPKTATARNFEVTAVTAAAVLPNGRLEYTGQNGHNFSVSDPMGGTHQGPLNDPTAILYVRSSDLDPVTGKLKAGVPIEPLILRAAAGDCINVTLSNNLPAVVPDKPGYNTMPMIVDNFNANQVVPSSKVGLHPQLLLMDVTRSDGANVGFMPTQTANPGGKTTYQWYAGDLLIDSTGYAKPMPIEFGAINLISSDPIKHSNKGALGALIIEPQGSTWIEDAKSRAQATVTPAGATAFREFVTIFQNDLNLRFADGTAVPNLSGEEDPEDSAQKAVNYRTEPMWTRLNYWPATQLSTGDINSGLATRDFDYTNALSNSQIGGYDPVTPIFTATVGQPVRFRVLQPNGHARNNVFDVHGHSWQETPYINNSTVIGSNPFSEVKGAQWGIGPSNHTD
ncbi:MAG: manganese oxidase, partial [Acidobacteriota bacterium]|nr:manganese oxidase [Acidobacteriota bacterium]